LARNGDRFIGGGLLEGLHFAELLDGAARTIGWIEPPAASGSADGGGSQAVDGVSGSNGSPRANGTTDGDGSESIGRPQTVRRGMGIALTLKTVKTPTMASAVCRLNEDGSLNLLSSAVEMGQGVMTAMAQVAADALDLPLERVSVSEPDTDLTPYDQGTTA